MLVNRRDFETFLMTWYHTRWLIVERCGVLKIYLAREPGDNFMRELQARKIIGVEIRFWKLGWWQCRLQPKQWIRQWDNGETKPRKEPKNDQSN